jgi:hypothetical protein
MCIFHSVILCRLEAGLQNAMAFLNQNQRAVEIIVRATRKRPAEDELEE